ncbi:hypothetical protein [Nonomuraea dietziae]|uniref:hypothetical protein n=1 Tax=Nonomuraea dietziae TaxID=65515 RepID=UPI0034435F4B
MLLASQLAVDNGWRWWWVRRSTALLLVAALVALPALHAAAPPDCRVQPLTDAEYLALQESFLENLPKEYLSQLRPTPSATASHGYMADVKPGAVAPIGVEIVEPPGCPEISGQ